MTTNESITRMDLEELYITINKCIDLLEEAAGSCADSKLLPLLEEAHGSLDNLQDAIGYVETR